MPLRFLRSAPPAASCSVLSRVFPVGISRFSALLSVAAAAFLATPAAIHAQTASGAPLVVVTSAAFAFYVASDTAGNVYSVSSSTTGVYKQTRASNGSYTASTLSITLPSQGTSVAVDAAGRVFVGLQSGDLVRYTPSGSTYTGPVYVATSAGKGTTPARGFALDGAGNVYIPDQNNAAIYKETVSGSTYTQTTLSFGIASPLAVAVDTTNNLYIIDASTNTMYKESFNGSYTKSTIATSVYGYGLAIDSTGAIYVPDIFNPRSRILRETPVAGGTGYTQTVLSYDAIQTPYSISLDSNGDLFIGSAPTGGVAATGILEIVGGSTFFPITAVGSSATEKVGFNILTSGTLGSLTNANVLLQGLSGLDFTLGSGSTCTGAVTAGGTCYVNVTFKPQTAGLRLGAVNLLNSAGTVIATAYLGGTGTGPLGTFAPGILSTAVATGTACSPATSACGDGGSATTTGANLNNPQAVTVDSVGNLYIADGADNRIRKLTAATNVLSTIAGTGSPCSSSTAACGDGGLATAAMLADPTGVALDGAGNLYIADRNDQRIRVVNLATGIISAFAGNGTGCATATAACGDGSAATAANISYPNDVTADVFGNVYISTYDQKIRKVMSSTRLISTAVGSGNQCSPSTATCGDGSGITYPSASLSFPGPIAVDAAQNLYIADSGDNRIRLASATNSGLSTIAGTGASCTGTATCGDGGAATSATFYFPYGLVQDAAGNLYVSDNSSNRIRKISASTNLVSTIAGTGTNCSPSTAVCGDGGLATAPAANLGYPAALAIDSSGNLYIPEQGTNRVRKVSVTTSINFPTPTSAGSADTTDGIRTASLNNIGNAALTISGMSSSNGSFILGNPMSGGCPTAGTLASGATCILGEQFQPLAGSSGVVIGALAITDNNLGVSGAAQSLPLTGSTVAGGLSVTVANQVVTAGSPYTSLGVVVSYSGASPDRGALSLTVNGSAAGVSTPTCSSKGSHTNCSYTYSGALLNTAGNYPIVATIAADTADGYNAGTGTNTLTVNGVASSLRPVSGPLSVNTSTGSTVKRTGMPAPSAAVVATPMLLAPASAPQPESSDADTSTDSTATKKLKSEDPR